MELLEGIKKLPTNPTLGHQAGWQTLEKAIKNHNRDNLIATNQQRESRGLKSGSKTGGKMMTCPTLHTRTDGETETQNHQGETHLAGRSHQGHHAR